MRWLDIIPFTNKVLGYFGPEKHEERVIRKFIGRWDKIRPFIEFEGKKQDNHLKMMDALRSELR